MLELVGRSESVARLECSSGTRIRMDGYRPVAASGRVARKQPYNAIGTLECLQGFAENLVLDTGWQYQLI